MAKTDILSFAAGCANVLLVGAAVFLIDGFFESNQLASLVLGTAAVVLLGGRVGLRSDESDESSPASLARKMMFGLGVGVLFGLLALGASALLGWAKLTPGSPLGMGALFGLVVPIVQAARDELMYRGVPLTVAEGRVPDAVAIPFCALLGVAPHLLSRFTVEGLFLIGTSGLLFGLLWRLGRGMYVGWGAHAGWLFMIGAGSRGVLLEATWAKGSLIPPEQARGPAVWLVAVLFVLACVVVARRLRLESRTKTASS